METKICSKCKEEKGLSEFNKNRSTKDGLSGQCRKCQNEYNGTKETRAMRYQANKESLREKARIYRELNRDRIRERDRNWKRNNAEKVKLRKRDYYERNKGEYYTKNKERILNAARRYSHRNKNKLKVLNKIYREKTKESGRFKRLEQAKRWRDDNRDRIRENSSRLIADIPDWYVVGQLTKRRGDLSPADVRSNPELIQLKRLEIALKRKRKEITKK